MMTYRAEESEGERRLGTAGGGGILSAEGRPGMRGKKSN